MKAAKLSGIVLTLALILAWIAWPARPRPGAKVEPGALPGAGAASALGSSPPAAEPPGALPATPGFQPACWEGVRAGSEIDFTLAWLAVLAGTVRDAESGAPLPEVRILVAGGGETRTDERGAYRLADVPAGRPGLLYARRDGYAELTARIELAGPGETTLDFAMRRGLVLAGRVVDRETAAPVAGAEMRSRSHFDPLTVTDAEGRFEVRLLPGVDSSLEVTAEGYCSFRWYGSIPESDGGLSCRIPLATPAWIEGLVLDEAGEPVEGAMVHCRSDDHPFGEWDLTTAEREAVGLPGEPRFVDPPAGAGSDARGQFRCAVFPGPSPQRLQAYLADGRTAESEPFTVLSAKERPWVEIRVPRGATIRGRVTRNDAPWSGFVRWRRPDGSDQGRARTDAAGSYELLHVPAGEILLDLEPPFGVPHSSRREVTITVEPGRTYEQDFSWQEDLATIRGRATSVAGAPLAGVNAWAEYFDGEGGVATFTARTAADGAYSIEVCPGFAYQVAVGRGCDAEDSRPDVFADAEGADFVLPDLGRLLVRLVDAATGEAIQVDRLSVWTVLSWRVSGEGIYRDSRVRLSLDGTALLQLPAGAVDLSVYLTELGYAPRLVIGIEVTADPAPAPLVVALTAAGEATLVFRATDGSPLSAFQKHHLFLLADAELELLHEPTPRPEDPGNIKFNGISVWIAAPGLLQRWLVLDEGGRASVRGLPPGTYTIRAIPADFRFDPERVEIGEETGSPIEIRWRAK
ncbi:MAG: carboxypeptidase regulatory-like domain-containing protein [Planctomycetota bacterium]